MAMIDSSARIAEGAVIGQGATIGPYCVIGPDTVISPFASLGNAPQSVKYRGGPTRLEIGSNCDIRENVTMNTGTEDGNGVTRVGDRCFFMVGSHIAHDCVVGNDVTFANNAVLGGHVIVGDFVFFGGHSAVHQFVRIGEGAMIGGMSGARTDVMPFGFALGQLADLVGLNIVGLRRRGVSRADMHRLRRAYRLLFSSEGHFAERVDAVSREFEDDAIVGKIVAFIRDGGSRPLMKARAQRESGTSADAES
jgi:UDP-N-acetylglucosamine acyltransferase